MIATASCPACAGPLGEGAEAGRFLCGRCGLHWLEGAGGGTRARRPASMQDVAAMPDHLVQALSRAGQGPPRDIVQRDLLLPFWQLRAQLVGWVRYLPPAPATRAFLDEEPSAPATLAAPAAREREETVSRPVSLSLPACDARSLGLPGIADRADRIEWTELEPTELPDRELCAATVPRELVLRRGRLSASSGLVPGGALPLAQRVSLLRPQLELLYYPVHLFHYQLGGEPFRAVLDGVRARPLQLGHPGPRPAVGPAWLVAAAAAGAVASLDPVLGACGLAGWAAWRGHQDGVGGDPAAWASWLSGELGGRPRRVERREGGDAWD